MQKIRKAIIPAAGFGTRFLPATKAMPKEMLPIVDKPTIQYIAEEILESGIDQILIISGHAKRAIEDHFDSSPELESHLYEHGKMSVLKEIRKISSIKFIMSGSSTCGGWETRFSVRKISWTASHSVSFSVMMSYTTRRSLR